jgi:hypothetical protein
MGEPSRPKPKTFRYALGPKLACASAIADKVVK